MKRTPLKPSRDPVTPAVRLAVLQRDGGCVAPRLGASYGSCNGPLTLDHVKDQPKVGDPVVKRGPERKHRYRAPSDAAHLVTVCAFHHLEGWATSHRPDLRLYLAFVTEHPHVELVPSCETCAHIAARLA